MVDEKCVCGRQLDELRLVCPICFRRLPNSSKIPLLFRNSHMFKADLEKAKQWLQAHPEA